MAVLLAAPADAAELPRLAGTVLGPGERIALFQAGTGGGDVPVGIGEGVGEYVVREIGPGWVQLDRADQQITVSIERAVSPVSPIDVGGVTFGMVLHQHGPADD